MLSEILPWAIASTAVAISAGKYLHYNRLVASYQRSRQWYESQSDVLAQSIALYQDQTAERQLCGGCGKSMTADQIAQCPGEACPHYQETAPQKKIPIGLNGFLHTDR